MTVNHQESTTKKPLRGKWTTGFQPKNKEEQSKLNKQNHL